MGWADLMKPGDSALQGVAASFGGGVVVVVAAEAIQFLEG